MSASDVQWIKLSIAMFDDEKIKLLEQMPDYRALQLIWVKLICHAGKTNSHGYIFLSENMPYTMEQLAILFREPPKTIELALLTFEKLGMITSDTNGIFINNFEKHQDLDKIAHIKELTRKRVEKYRNKPLELQACNVTVTDDVTQCNATEKNRVDSVDYIKREVEDTAAIFSKFEDLVGGKYNHMDAEKIKSLSGDYSTEWILAAIEQANIQGKRNLAYVVGTLERCRTSGIKPGTPKVEAKKEIKSIYPMLK